MNHQVEINSAKYIYISKILEYELNCLEFELTIAKASEIKEELEIGKINLGQVSRIITNEHSPVYKITFDAYIGYSVLNESYINITNGKFTGRNIRIYTESFFLDYIKKDTFATKDYPGEFLHYMFLGQDHIINIASSKEPNILKIK